MRSTLYHTTALVALLASNAPGVMAQTANDIVGGGSTLAAPYYEQEFTSYEATYTSVTLSYFPLGSGPSKTAFINNNGSAFSTSFPSGQSVDFAATDASLATSEVVSWSTVSTGQTVAGNLIQIPMFGTPITIPYKPTGFASGSAGSSYPNSLSGTNSLPLTDSDLCGIFSGKITNWNSSLLSHPPVTASTPITVVYRADGSGTSFLFTQHLAAVCTSGGNSNISWTASTSFAGEFSGGVPSNFVGGTGSPGVQAAIDNNNDSVGYLSPDYTQMVSAPSGGSSAAPVVATVNGIVPTSGNTSTALATAPTISIGSTFNVFAWVPVAAKPTSGYPIVGYTNWDVAQCYASSTVTTNLLNFLTDYTGGSFDALITANGFTPDTSAIKTDIKNYLLTNLHSKGWEIGDSAACHGKTGR